MERELLSARTLELLRTKVRALIPHHPACNCQVSRLRLLDMLPTVRL